MLDAESKRDGGVHGVTLVKSYEEAGAMDLKRLETIGGTMLEEFVEVAFPGGALIAGGVAVGAAFGQQLRPAAKQVLKTGMRMAAQAQEIAAEAYEQGRDLIAEARHEVEQESADGISA